MATPPAPLRVSVVIPVGPGHQDFVPEVIRSVSAAWTPPGLEVETILVPDEQGEMGRSAARNFGVTQSSGEWILFIDADDLLQAEAFGLFAREIEANPRVEGVWGALRRVVSIWDPVRLRVTGRRIMEPDDMKTRETDRARIMGLSCWLNVGHFIHRDLHERVGGWCEGMDLTEDYEYLWACLAHARDFVKIPEPLVAVRANLRSAVGPRGYELTVFEDSTHAVATMRGEAIRRYWKQRGWGSPWSKAERAGRPGIYGGPWPRFGGEP